MAKATAAQPSKPTIVAQTKTFVQEVRTEMDKVTWPSKDDLKSHTSVVLIFLAVLALLVGAMDVVFQNIILFLFRLF